MNERIKELAEQAREYATTQHPVSNITLSVNSDLFEQKFAELIVRECAKFLDENSGYDDSNNAWHPQPEDLLQHFGVEE